MRVYSYRSFEAPRQTKTNPHLKKPFSKPKTSLTPGLAKVDFNLFGQRNSFVFQLVSICLLTLGLLLGFQVLTENAEVDTLANASGEQEVRALSNFGKNISPDKHRELKEIIANQPEPETEAESLEETTETASPAPAQTITYTVKSGDNLYSIALEYGVEFTDIAEDNELSRPYNLQIGQQLYINP
jgi:hypothetical protein